MIIIFDFFFYHTPIESYNKNKKKKKKEKSLIKISLK